MNAAVMGTDSDPFYGAPCVVVVLVEPERYTAVEDGSLVLGNLMQAAYDIGVGSCWIHRARQMFESEEGKALLRKWGLREDLIGVGNCILGYADEIPAPKPRREGRIIKI
jgi:nitroreductase